MEKETSFKNTKAVVHKSPKELEFWVNQKFSFYRL